ncbi:MAG: sensor histidine kinase, partial [Burkholderiaceae bacterium]
DLPLWQGRLPDRGPYAALVDFYDDRVRGDAVRVAVLLQPVASRTGLGMATIQVAETLELRQTLARQILFDTLLRQSLLAAVIALVVVLVVQRATRPVRSLSGLLRAREEGDLTPIEARNLPGELHPLVDATNQVMARLQGLLEHQKRFVRDASHQLRTPLAVLNVQVQSALRGDVDQTQALREINGTVERATVLANQMLALAKVEQLRHQSDGVVLDLATVVRAVALDLAPLIADKELDFEIQTVAAPIRAHEWMVRELVRNLLHNAVKYAPAHSALEIRLVVESPSAVLTVSDQGPGIAANLRIRLFQPFAAGHNRSGSGLGLMLCREIVTALGGQIILDNRMTAALISGLDASVRLPLAAGGADHPVDLNAARNRPPTA